MGRLVAAQRQCSRVDLFKDAVAGVFTHAYKRGYSRRLLHATWTRFLVTYWDAAGVTSSELRQWFHEVWRRIVKQNPTVENTRLTRGAESEEGLNPTGRHRPVQGTEAWGSVPQQKGNQTQQRPPRDEFQALLDSLTPEELLSQNQPWGQDASSSSTEIARTAIRMPQEAPIRSHGSERCEVTQRPMNQAPGESPRGKGKATTAAPPAPL